MTINTNYVPIILNTYYEKVLLFCCFDHFWYTRAEICQIFRCFFGKFKKSKRHSEINWPLSIWMLLNFGTGYFWWDLCKALLIFVQNFLAQMPNHLPQLKWQTLPDQILSLGTILYVCRYDLVKKSTLTLTTLSIISTDKTVPLLLIQE